MIGYRSAELVEIFGRLGADFGSTGFEDYSDILDLLRVDDQNDIPIPEESIQSLSGEEFEAVLGTLRKVVPLIQEVVGLHAVFDVPEEEEGE